MEQTIAEDFRNFSALKVRVINRIVERFDSGNKFIGQAYVDLLRKPIHHL
jgi:hypothetical protein